MGLCRSLLVPVRPSIASGTCHMPHATCHIPHATWHDLYCTSYHPGFQSLKKCTDITTPRGFVVSTTGRGKPELKSSLSFFLLGLLRQHPHSLTSPRGFVVLGFVRQERVLEGLVGATESNSSSGANKNATGSSTTAAAATAISVGDRVVRGPAWSWGDQDGGPGGYGTVIDVRGVAVCSRAFWLTIPL